MFREARAVIIKQAGARESDEVIVNLVDATAISAGLKVQGQRQYELLPERAPPQNLIRFNSDVQRSAAP